MKRVLATLILTLLVIAKPAAAADMWGCEVLLCLANPAGPTAVSQCVPPITKLWKHLAKGKSFPTCPMASSSTTGKSYAQLGTDYFSVCPKDTTMIFEGKPPSGSSDGYDAGSPRLCAGNLISTTTLCGFGDGGCQSVPVYDVLTSMSPHANGGVIDIYVSDAFFSRVHWQDNAWGGAVGPAQLGVKVSSGTCVGHIACAQ